MLVGSIGYAALPSLQTNQVRAGTEPSPTLEGCRSVIHSNGQSRYSVLCGTYEPSDAIGPGKVCRGLGTLVIGLEL